MKKLICSVIFFICSHVYGGVLYTVNTVNDQANDGVLQRDTIEESLDLILEDIKDSCGSFHSAENIGECWNKLSSLVHEQEYIFNYYGIGKYLLKKINDYFEFNNEPNDRVLQEDNMEESLHLILEDSSKYEDISDYVQFNADMRGRCGSFHSVENIGECLKQFLQQLTRSLCTHQKKHEQLSEQNDHGFYERVFILAYKKAVNAKTRAYWHWLSANVESFQNLSHDSDREDQKYLEYAEIFEKEARRSFSNSFLKSSNLKMGMHDENSLEMYYIFSTILNPSESILMEPVYLNCYM